MKNLKISKYFNDNKKKIVSSAAAGVILFAPSAFDEVQAADLSELNPTTTIVTTDTTTTETTEVSYSDTQTVDTEKEKNNKVDEYTDKQEDIQNDIENLGGTYDYTVDVEEVITPNPDIIIDTTIENKDADIKDVVDNLDENIEIVDVDAIPIKEEQEENLNEVLPTKNEAEEALENFKDDIDNKNGTVSNEEIIEIYTGSTNENTPNAYTDLTEEEALAKKQELEASDGNEHDFVITVTLNGYLKDTGLDDEKSISKEFNSMKEAEEYLDSLEKQGYTITSSSIKLNTHEENRSLNETYNTIEEANEALENFKNTYNNATGKVEEVRDITEDTSSKTTGTEEFTTLEEANNKASSLEVDNHDVKVTATVRKETSQSTIESVVTKTFETEQEAIDYLDTLRADGYTITDYDIEKSDVVYIPVLPEINYGTGTGHINNRNGANMFIRIDGSVQYEDGTTGYDNSYYVYAGRVGVSGNIVYDTEADKKGDDLVYLINNNNKIGEEITVAISEEQIKDMLKTYGIKLGDDQVVVWYVLKDQIDGATSRTYTDMDGNDVIVNLPGCSYHIDGVIRSKSQIANIYNLTGNMEKDSYYVDTETVNKGYDYKAEATGTETVSDETYNLEAEATKDIMETKYNLDVNKETKNYEYQVSANGKYDKLTGYKILIKNNTKTYKVSTTGKGSYNVITILPPEIPTEDPKVIKSNTPQTGDDSDLAISFGALGVSAMGISTILVRKRKLEREEKEEK